MLNAINYYAHCNHEINTTMVGIIKNADNHLFSVPIEGYYKSINAILDHYFIADTVWLKAFRQARDSSIFDTPIMLVDRNWGELQFKDIDSFAIARSELDGIMISYMKELKPEDLDKTITRVNRKGERMEKVVWKSILHMFNHDTHHRGQISLVLDQKGIENDYSNMIRYD